MTRRQRQALEWLSERGGSGVVTNQGYILAAGETSHQFAPVTWLKLLAMGTILRGREGRVEVTAMGLDELEEKE